MKVENKELNARVVAMILSGAKGNEIMDTLRITRGQLAGIRHRRKPALGDDFHLKDREEDERILLAIRLRVRGANHKEIASLTGKTVAWVANKTYCVMQEDLKLSGEKQGAVREAYW